MDADRAKLEVFIESFDPTPPSPFNFARARRVCQVLRNAGARPDLVEMFDRVAWEAGVPATLT